MPEPEIAVVAATRNRAGLLPRLVAALEAQEDAPPFEVVLVDDASTDDTPAVLARLEASSAVPLRTIRHDRRRGPGPARNAAWRLAATPKVLFTDDDCVPRPGWVKALADALDHQDLVQGTTVPAPDQLANQGTFSRTLEVTSATGFFQTCNMGYRRATLEHVGGFDEALDRPAGEDTDLALRCIAAGASFEFIPDAVVEHDVRPSSLRAAVKDTWRWQGIVGAIAKHPQLGDLVGSRWFWKPSHPPVIAAAAGLALALASRRPLALAAGASLTVPYLRHRLLVDPVHPGRAGRVRYLGHAFLVDGGEVVALARGSVKYRTLFL